MTIEEAIYHLQELADSKFEQMGRYDRASGYANLMIELMVKKTDCKIKADGMNGDIIAEMMIALKLFNDNLKEEDEEIARAFQRTLLESQTYIFGHDQTEKVFKEIQES